VEKILIMGLPGSGKTFLARHLVEQFQAVNKTVAWFNADEIREKYNDWDFSREGRIRQSLRMSELAKTMENIDYVVCDFVAPLQEMRDNFAADWTIWMDTITEGRYADTNKMFDAPAVYNFRVTEQDSEKWSKLIATEIVNRYV
jgi:adenylylsulfate kinase